MNALKKVPQFKTEAKERRFWQTADAGEYVDFSKMERWVFPNLKLSSKPITIWIPESILDRVKARANQKDMPYQTLIKQFIYRGLGII